MIHFATTSYSGNHDAAHHSVPSEIFQPGKFINQNGASHSQLYALSGG